jgi:predicted methyltransferase
MMTRIVLLAAAAVALATQAACSRTEPYVPPAGTPAHILRALESSERTAEHRAVDARRKPAEIMMLAGVKEGDRIVELAGFGHYFSTLLAAAVGPSGKIYIYDLPYTERFAGESSRAFDAAHDNVEYHQEDYDTAQLPESVDAVWNVLYYHDLRPNGIDTVALNRKIFAALKPGGVFLVIDHKAEDGSGWRDARPLHRMGIETIKEEVLAAGFELVDESDLLANPDDDRTTRVFALDGATDQAVLLFRKPVA